MLRLHIVFFQTEPPQGNLAIRTPITEVPGEFVDLDAAISTAITSAPHYPAATWIVIEDEQINEFVRLFRVNGAWERQNATRP